MPVEKKLSSGEEERRRFVARIAEAVRSGAWYDERREAINRSESCETQLQCVRVFFDEAVRDDELLTLAA